MTRWGSPPSPCAAARSGRQSGRASPPSTSPSPTPAPSPLRAPSRSPTHLLDSPQSKRRLLGLLSLLGLLGLHANGAGNAPRLRDRKSTRLNSSHSQISYAVFCLKKKKTSASR